jgi:hypothetical protein
MDLFSARHRYELELLAANLRFYIIRVVSAKYFPSNAITGVPRRLKAPVPL